METPEKVRENRVRRAVYRRGYGFIKSRLRDPDAVGYGRVRIQHSGGGEADGFESPDGLGLTLDEIEERLVDGEWAVYRLYAGDETLLYVGSSNGPHNRYGAHSLTQEWWPDVARKEETWYPKRSDALKAEAEAVRTEKPLHNKRLTADARTVPVSIRVSDAEAAMINAARGNMSISEWLRTVTLSAARASGRKPRPTDVITITVDDRMPAGTAAFVSRGKVTAFNIGPEPDRVPKNCKHPNFRGIKGVCPDCHEWVTGKR